MPFVNIRILEGHPQARKDEISRRVTEAISEVAELPKEAIWVVFEDVAAVAWVHRHATEWGGDPDRISISGHSAGGHLVTMLLATDWPALGVPADVVKSGCAISGLYDLEPIRLCYLNQVLALTSEVAQRNSPVLLAPSRPTPLDPGRRRRRGSRVPPADRRAGRGMAGTRGADRGDGPARPRPLLDRRRARIAVQLARARNPDADGSGLTPRPATAGGAGGRRGRQGDRIPFGSARDDPMREGTVGACPT